MSARRGQSILEYTMIVGILTVVLFYMGTGIKRGMQSLVKVTADQVGNQANSDQDFNDITTGYMNSSITTTADSNNRMVNEFGYLTNTGTTSYITNSSFNEYTQTLTNTLTNGGFTPGQ